MKPQKFEAVVTSKEWLSKKVLQLELDPVEPDVFEFTPGQFVSLYVGDGKYRAYSIWSDYKDEKRFSIVISAGHIGLGSNYVKGLKVGDKVEFIGPSGNFRLEKPLSRGLYFFATEVGIAPFVAMFYELVDMDYGGEIKLFLGVRDEKNVFFERPLAGFKNSLSGFSYEVCVSAPGEGCEHRGGRITDVLSEIKSGADCQFYLCGNPDMVDEVTTGLLEKSVPTGNIKGETFRVSL